MALFLVAIGLYGLITQLVGKKVKEIGIRMALGAERATVLRQVVFNALRLAIAGIAIGLPVAYAAGQFVSGEFYGIALYDPLAIGACIVTILAVSTIASLLPAKRAAAVDPLVALRQD